MLNLPLSHIEAKFILDGKTYNVEKFKIKFSQPVDFKGQPQHETRGGKLTVVITQMADNNLLLWSKTPTLLKNGSLLFQTDLGITVLRVEFENAYCITLSRKINALTGTLTTLVISSEIVKMNDVEHDNFWPG
ncbi:MAG: type VI secretion system needle protein Hcp [Tannerella sp.]|jgi:predicted metallo-beta-lactamase superfamily hydrolase|nr:type VI secretion system needle protein Hcp [Tannerella sp.]